MYSPTIFWICPARGWTRAKCFSTAGWSLFVWLQCQFTHWSELFSLLPSAAKLQINMRPEILLQYSILSHDITFVCNSLAVLMIAFDCLCYEPECHRAPEIIQIFVAILLFNEQDFGFLLCREIPILYWHEFLCLNKIDV